jgi:hypothetical protein
MWNSYFQAAEVAQRRTAVSSKCFQLYYTCSDILFVVVLPPCSFHIFPPLTVTFPKLAVILRPLYCPASNEVVAQCNTAHLVHVDGVRLSLWAAATNWPIVHPSDGTIWVWRATAEWYWQEKTEELGGKPVPVSFCSSQFPHGLTRARTRVAVVKTLLLTAWVMVLRNTAYLNKFLSYSVFVG